MRKKALALLSVVCVLTATAMPASAGYLSTGINGDGSITVNIDSTSVSATTSKGTPGQNYYRYVAATTRIQLQSGQWTTAKDSSTVYTGIASVSFNGIRDAEYVTSTHRVDTGYAQTFTLRK